MSFIYDCTPLDCLAGEPPHELDPAALEHLLL